MADVEESMVVENDALLIGETPQMENSARAENDLIFAPHLCAASHLLDTCKNIHFRRGGGSIGDTGAKGCRGTTCDGVFLLDEPLRAEHDKKAKERRPCSTMRAQPVAPLAPVA
jgi:hypothetical protein